MSAPQHQPYQQQQPYQPQQWPLQQAGYGQGGYGGPGGWSQPPVGTQPGEPVGFLGAIQNFFRKYAQFSGRASRSEYWWATLALMLGFILVAFFMVTLPLLAMIPSASGGDASASGGVAGALIAIGILGYSLFALAAFVPSLALTVRRLHDTDRSGWWYFISFVPFIGAILLLIFTIEPSNPQGARFDA